MNSPLPRIPKELLHTLSLSKQSPVCPICQTPVPLEIAKTDEDGVAIHEQCYLFKVKLNGASTA